MNEAELVLVSFGHVYGRPESSQKNFNLRKLPTPRLAGKRFGRTGLDKDLQKEFFELSGVEELYLSILKEVTERLEAARLAQEEEEGAEAQSDEAQAGEIEDGESKTEDGDAEEEKDEDAGKEGDEAEGDQEGGGFSTVVIGIGCQIGKHRSVAMTEMIAAEMTKSGVRVAVVHRDISRSPKEARYNKKDLSRQKHQQATWE